MKHSMLLASDHRHLFCRPVSGCTDTDPKISERLVFLNYILVIFFPDTDYDRCNTMFTRRKGLPEIKATKPDSGWQCLATTLITLRWSDWRSSACLLASRKASGLVLLQVIVFNERMKLLGSNGLEGVAWQYCRTFKGISWNFQAKAPKLGTEKASLKQEESATRFLNLGHCSKLKSLADFTVQ